MELQVRFRMNEHLFIRNPEDSELGRRIVRASVLMMRDLGFEAFTFKKLAIEIKTTEASIYRYFENKHRLLVYLVTWYWGWLQYQVILHSTNISDPEQKIKRIIKLLATEIDDSLGFDGLDQKALYQIVVWEGSKAYLTRHVTEDNKAHLFKPYKDLAGQIAEVFRSYNPDYRFTRSLASTLIEMAHYQIFFMHNLPSLTDFGVTKDEKEVYQFLEELIFSALNQKRN